MLRRAIVKRRSHARRGGAAAEAAPNDGWLRELALRGRDPASWQALAEDELLLIAYQQCLFFGATAERETGEALGMLYRTLLERVPAGERLELLGRVTEAVSGKATPVLALLPFLQHDDDVAIVRQAATTFASLMPLTAGDEMSGPRTLVAMSEHADSAAAQAGLIQGVLLLGDRRTCELLRGALQRLEPEARALALRCDLPFAYASVIETLLDWLADADPATADGLAAWLARLPAVGRGRVLDVRRKFPEDAGDERPEIEVVSEWPAREYAARFALRLREWAGEPAMAARLRAVEVAWGLTPEGGDIA